MERSETTLSQQNPRMDFLQAIKKVDLVWCLEKTAEIHGHFCPGSALGVMASVYGLGQLEEGIIHSDGMENLMAVVEINACFADGVQVVSGCTLGNNAMVYRDLGRLAVTFAVRGGDAGVRVRVLPDFRSTIETLVPEFYPLMKKVIIDRECNMELETAFKQKGREAAFALLQTSFDKILTAQKVIPCLPEYAPITESALCPGCGEMIMSTKIANDGEKRGYCLACAGGSYYQVEGQGIVKGFVSLER